MTSCWDHAQTHLSGSNSGGVLPPCTITSHNAEQAAKWQGTSQHTRRFKPWTVRSSPTLRTPTVRPVVNVLARAALSLSMGGVLAASLDDCKEDGEEEAFHQFHWKKGAAEWGVEGGHSTPTPSDAHFPQQESLIQYGKPQSGCWTVKPAWKRRK